MSRTPNPPQTHRIPLSSDSGTRLALESLLAMYERACKHVLAVSSKTGYSHQASLHALVYRDLCPKKPALGTTSALQVPSQYAVRAISRISHQIRCSSKGLPDPYPARSIDLDSRICALDPLSGLVRVTPLESLGIRGSAARGGRLVLLADFPSDLHRALCSSMHTFLGGHLVLPRKAAPYLIARIAILEDTA